MTSADAGTDAVPREAAWLVTHGDGLPALLVANGGKWDIVQAYWPGARLSENKRGVYVTRRNLSDARPNDLRVRDSYQFFLKIVWPVKSAVGSAGLAEGEQAALDAAMGDLIVRIRGPFNDKTHGGRFLSVGEVPSRSGWPQVAFADPEQTIPAQRALRATVQYYADDIEVLG